MKGRLSSRHLLVGGFLAGVTGLLVSPSISGSQHVPPPAAAPLHEPTGLVPHAVALGDFNGDGIPDIAVPAAAERKVTVLLSDGKGGFAGNDTYPTGRGPSWVEVGDWNGDGKLDLVTANTGGGSLTLYFGDGTGKFGSHMICGTTNIASFARCSPIPWPCFS